MKTKSRILVVDDDPAVLEVLKAMLRLRGHQVCTAPSGQEGLRLARAWRPEVVLLDVRLPDLAGTEVCRRIKSDPALVDVFVILLSGQAISPAQKAGGLDTGADEYLTKPVDADELAARVRTVARLRHTTAALRASEQHYRGLVEILPDAVGLLDEQGRLRAINPQGLATLGWEEAGGLLGQHACELAVPEERERFRADLARALQTGSLRNAQYLLLGKDGRRVPVELSAARLTEGPSQPACLAVVARDITERKRAEEELRRLPWRIIQAQEGERQRVARELHDSVNQLLASAKMRLRKVEEGLGPLRPAAAEALGRCYELLVQALEENRRIAQALRPSDLDALGLVEACRNLCKELERRSTLEVSCQLGPLEQRLPPTVELNLFRIVQESLANVEQHAKATKVALALRLRDGWLDLVLEDNGCGFDPKSISASPDKRRCVGLTNLRERAAALGGVCQVNSAPGRGTAVRVRVKV